jgi:hypothetical protein
MVEQRRDLDIHLGVTRRRFTVLLGSVASSMVMLPGAPLGGTVIKAGDPGGRMKTGVSYFGSRDPRHLREDMHDIAAHHCTFVVHTFSEADYHFYPKAMKQAVALSHAAGLEVYLDPWGVGGVFGGEAFSRFVMENPDQCQRLADGSALPCACLNREAFRAFMKKWVDAAVDTGADCLFWDEPHFYIPRAVWRGAQRPDEWACTCPACQKLFKARFGYAMPKVMDDDVVAFRDESIVSFFTEMTGYAKAKGVRNALCVLPQENPLIGISSWEKLAALPAVDIFGTDPYWIVFGKPVDDYVRTAAKKIVDISARYGKQPQMWVQAYGVPAGREPEVDQAVRIIASEGIGNIAAWSYRGGAPMNLASDNPDRVWEILGKAYGEVRSYAKAGVAGNPA